MRFEPSVDFTDFAKQQENNEQTTEADPMVWTPNEGLRVELTAPRPRIARRVSTSTFQGASVEEWFYVAGEFGGGTWAVERTPGLSDELTFRDFRLVVGYESKSPERFRNHLEFGYVFARMVEYESDEFRLSQVMPS